MEINHTIINYDSLFLSSKKWPWAPSRRGFTSSGLRTFYGSYKRPPFVLWHRVFFRAVFNAP